MRIEDRLLIPLLIIAPLLPFVALALFSDPIACVRREAFDFRVAAGTYCAEWREK